MKILFLTDNFPPEVNAPASRTFEHCREWARLGHEVTVITGVPNFPRGTVFPGYRNWPWQSETMDGIRVVRVWTYVAANRGVVRRTLDYLSFMASATVAGAFVARPQVVVGTSPQFFTVVAAWIVSWIRCRPFVFELRDLWPESIYAVAAVRAGWALRMMDRLAMFLYRRAARIVAVTQSFRGVLAGRGVDATKIRVVTNGVDLGRFRPRPRDQSLALKLGLEGRFVAGYVGTHGMAHGLETILDAAERIAKSPDAERFRFVLLGDGACKAALRADAMHRGLRNVLFLDTVPKEEVARYWSLLDVAIVHLKRDAVFRTVIPSKLFECMGMGIPVLHGVEGESAGIVREHCIGRCFEPGNGDALAAAVRGVAADTREMEAYRMACLAAAPRFDRGQLAARMLAVLEEMRIAPVDTVT